MDSGLFVYTTKITTNKPNKGGEDGAQDLLAILPPTIKLTITLDSPFLESPAEEREQEGQEHHRKTHRNH